MARGNGGVFRGHSVRSPSDAGTGRCPSRALRRRAHISQEPASKPMIITRSPLRISLGGGGTDIPSYYRDHTGFLVAAAIDRYVYITLHHTFVPELIIKYSKLERVSSVDQVEHPIFREALKLVGITSPSLEITSMADIPSG